MPGSVRLQRLSRINAGGAPRGKRARECGDRQERHRDQRVGRGVRRRDPEEVSGRLRRSQGWAGRPVLTVRTDRVSYVENDM